MRRNDAMAKKSKNKKYYLIVWTEDCVEYYPINNTVTTESPVEWLCKFYHTIGPRIINVINLTKKEYDKLNKVQYESR